LECIQKRNVFKNTHKQCGNYRISGGNQQSSACNSDSFPRQISIRSTAAGIIKRLIENRADY